MSRPPNKALPTTAPLNFLLGCSENSLANFELARLGEVADLRSELHAILDRVIDQMATAALAAWFRTVDRETLKHALENPDDVLAWAREQIRKQGRSDEELVPMKTLPPGAEHLAAALRYAERNVSKGLCCVCPTRLDPSSVRYCKRHLIIARLRKPPKNAKGEPGSIGWLYGDGVFESSHGKAPSRVKALKEANEKRTKKAKKQ